MIFNTIKSGRFVCALAILATCFKFTGFYYQRTVISGRCGPFGLNQVSLSYTGFLFAFIGDILFMDLAAL